jgi:hypothetical protein
VVQVLAGISLLTLALVAYKNTINVSRPKQVNWGIISLLNFTAGLWLLTADLIGNDGLAKLVMCLFLAICTMGVAFMLFRFVAWLHRE